MRFPLTKDFHKEQADVELLITGIGELKFPDPLPEVTGQDCCLASAYRKGITHYDLPWAYIFCQSYAHQFAFRAEERWVADVIQEAAPVSSLL